MIKKTNNKSGGSYSGNGVALCSTVGRPGKQPMVSDCYIIGSLCHGGLWSVADCFGTAGGDVAWLFGGLHGLVP